jgi:hypothetical protein
MEDTQTPAPGITDIDTQITEIRGKTDLGSDEIGRRLVPLPPRIAPPPKPCAAHGARSLSKTATWLPKRRWKFSAVIAKS